MANKPSVQRIHKRKSDVLFSQHVRLVGKCEKCGTSQTLQCAHWISRRYAWTRTDPRNAFCLCAGCHRYFTDRPTEFSDWALDQRGRLTWRMIRERSLYRTKFDWVEEHARLVDDPFSPPRGCPQPLAVARSMVSDGDWCITTGWVSPRDLSSHVLNDDLEVLDEESVGWSWNQNGHRLTLWQLI